MVISFFFFFEVAMLNYSPCSLKNRWSFVLLFFSLTPCIIDTVSYSHNSTDKVLMIHKVRVNSA